MAQTQQDIDEKQTQLDAAQKTLSTRVSTSYKNGATSLLDVLLSSSSLDDIINNIYYLNKINEQDEQTIDQVKALQEDLSAKQSELAQQEADQQTAVDQTQQDYDSYQAKVSEAQNYYNQLDSEMQTALATEAATSADASTDIQSNGLTSAVQAATSSDSNNQSASSGSNSSSSNSDSDSGSSSDVNYTGSSDVVANARQYIGLMYNNPFDCSLLTQTAYAEAGISIERTTWEQAAQVTNKKYSVDELSYGDLVFCNGYGHVGIYVGNGYMIDSPRPGKTIREAPISWYSFDCGGRPY